MNNYITYKNIEMPRDTRLLMVFKSFIDKYVVMVH